MGAPTAFRARIEGQPGEALGEVMGSIRVWLDRRRIDLAGFDAVPVTHGIVALDVYFRHEADVVRFRQEFGRGQLSPEVSS